MSKIELHTSVEETVECQGFPSITLKKVNLGKNNFWTPLRTVFLRSEIPHDIRKRILELRTKETLFEANRVIYKDIHYSSIKNAIAENDNKRIKNILKVNEKMAKKKISSVFSFSDFPQKKLENSFEDFLDTIYSFSEILFVPHIRYSKSSKTAVKYDAKQFCKYVDYAVNILNEKNNKPLFVPFDLDYPQYVRNEILSHCAKMGYTNIWVDCKGKGFDNRNTIRKMRSFWRSAKKIFDKNSKSLLIYQTNVRKIPRGVFGEDTIPPSDFLGIFDYGDFVGAPFKGIIGYFEDPEIWKKRGYTSKEDYERDLFRRNSSIFNITSYYYTPPDLVNFENNRLEWLKKAILETSKKCRYKAVLASYSINGLVTLCEANQIKREIMGEGRIIDYIKSKEFFKNEGVSLLDELLKYQKVGKSEVKTKSLFDFF